MSAFATQLGNYYGVSITPTLNSTAKVSAVLQALALHLPPSHACFQAASGPAASAGLPGNAHSCVRVGFLHAKWFVSLLGPFIVRPAGCERAEPRSRLHIL